MANITIRQIGTNALSCEPLIARCANGELLCVCQCGGTYEPAPENRVYAFHSADNGETWSKKESIYPEDGQAVYCTELTVFGEEFIKENNGKVFAPDTDFTTVAKVK